MERARSAIESMASEASYTQLPPASALSDVLGTKSWLDGQNYELSVAVKTESLSVLETCDVEELQERIAAHQVELTRLSTELAVKEHVVRKMQLNHVLCNKMFLEPLPGSGETAHTEDADQGDRQKYEMLLLEQSKLSSAILRKDEIVSELQKELDAVQKTNFELKKRNRSLMGIIKQHGKRLEQMAEDVKNNTACKGLKEELENTVSRVDIAKCTLQALIVGSGVNWAQDPDLLETVLLCGDTLPV